MEFPTGAGATSGPISPDAWKRAVYKGAPRYFYVELLSPEKQGSSHSYGLRICPIKDDNASLATRSSSSSGSGSLVGYDIWRKWEDCLWFQEALEVEYSRMAREKRNRLAAGKGIKKNGVYIHSDQAASFESLPPGPDPHSVAQDIHEYVPKLTKKGTLFRASQTTIEQRFAEFRVMIDALFTDDVPTLIKELKTTRTFTDFFGFWRRDHDLAKKSQLEPTPSKSRLSVSSSVFSTYFSASTPAFSDMSPSKTSQTQLQSSKPQKQPPYRSPTTSDASSSSSSVRPSSGTKLPVREQPTPSRSPATIVPSSRQRPNAGRQPVIVSQDVPLRFGHNPQHMSDVLVNERPTSMLESLPEDREFSSAVSVSKLEDRGLRPRRRPSSAASEANRNARIYHTPPHSPSGLSEHTQLPLDSSTPSPSRYPRYSWQTVHSSASARAAAYFAELDVDYSLPNPHPEHGHRPRASMCSMASVTSDSSADAVMPRYPSGQAVLSRSALNAQRRPRPMSLPEDEEGWPADELWLDPDNEGPEQDDLLDAYFYDSIRPHSPTPSSRPETPTASDVFYVTPPPEQYPPTYSSKRLSIPISISSGSTNSSYDGMNISIKAMHEENIIMLRVPRYLPFEEVREKIYDKFVQTDRSPISESFAIAFLVQPPSDTSGGVRSRASSLSSLGGPETRKAALHFVRSKDEWDQAIAHFGTKVSLRIIGSRE